MVKHLADVVMSGGYVVGGLVAVVALVIGAAWGITQKALGDMMSTEVKNRLADLPGLILRVTMLITASREDRKDLFEEYYGELAACVKDGDRYPVTRLVRGIGFALGVARAELTHFVLVRSAQIEGIVSDLLLLSRIRDPANAPGQSTIEVSEILDDILDELDPYAAQKGIECVLTASTGPAYVVGDPRELRAAFLHLVKNALTYSYRGSKVQVMFYTAGCEVSVIVADAGVGIAYEEQPEIFDLFYRGSNSAFGGSRGVGLGLTLVNRITRRHYGLLELDSRPGEGTEVALTLPGSSESGLILSR
jgi:signal transduction histidine kinase